MLNTLISTFLFNQTEHASLQFTDSMKWISYSGFNEVLKNDLGNKRKEKCISCKCDSQINIITV